MSHDFRVGESGDSEECSWCGVSRSASGNFRCTDETAPTSRQKSKIDFDWLNALKEEREDRFRVDPSEKALKFDDHKPPLDLLPFLALEEIAKVLAYGAKKYEPHNWRKGFVWSRLTAALLRHVFAWARGESKDKETGYSHLAHAGCMLLFLLEHELYGIGVDDRP